MNLDGKQKKEHVAHAICRDVGKNLFFCNPNVPTWDSLINGAKVMSFIDLLRKRGMQADGHLTKLGRHCDGLEYAEKYELVKSGPKEAFLTSIKSWKKTFVTGSAKRYTNAQAMIFLYKRCCSKTRNIFYSLKKNFFGA